MIGQMSRSTLVAAFAVFFLVASIAAVGRTVIAQTERPGPYTVGFRNTQIRNQYAGSSTIPCRVAYPAPLVGYGVPVSMAAAPHPVVLFAHGTNHTSAHYTQIADHLASWGFIVIAHDTHPRDRLAQIKDLEALVRIVGDLDVDPTSFLFGAVDESRIGIAGHSMGGGSVAGVLASTPTIRAGLLLAPSDTPAPNAANWMAAARAPFLVMCGSGDSITPFTTNALKFYQKGAGVAKMRALLQLWSGCDHFAVAYTNSRSTPANRLAFDLSRRYSTAFLLAALAGETGYYDYLVGASGRNEPKLGLAMVEIRSPELYLTGTPIPGGVIEYHFMGRAMANGILALSPFRGSTPLFDWGTLELAPGALFFAYVGALPADGVVHQKVLIPHWPALRGLHLHWQGVAQNAAGGYRLTPSRTLVIR